ncbi:MAG TPA: hypothetical protein VFR87_05200 [Nocardioidaceae bacterium]|nr:hypothetical protein [Nocardioidaceae bacterium]
MSTDAGQLEPRPDPPDLDLPEVTDVRTRQASMRPRRRNFESALPTVEDTVEVVVRTAAPIPVRALGPVLHVGDATLTEVTADDEGTYRFVATSPRQLRPGADIRLGWSGQPLERSLATGFRFEPPGEASPPS